MTTGRYYSNMLCDIQNEMIQAIWVFGKSILPESGPRHFELAYQKVPFPQVFNLPIFNRTRHKEEDLGFQIVCIQGFSFAGRSDADPRAGGRRRINIVPSLPLRSLA